MEPLTLVDRNGVRLATVLPGSAIVVGRSTECDVSLPDPTVSRRHAELRASDGNTFVRDLGSRNGTFRNGVRIDSARIRPGDVVSFGTFAVRIEAGVPLPTPTGAPTAASAPSVPRHEDEGGEAPGAPHPTRARPRPRSGSGPAYRDRDGAGAARLDHAPEPGDVRGGEREAGLEPWAPDAAQPTSGGRSVAGQPVGGPAVDGQPLDARELGGTGANGHGVEEAPAPENAAEPAPAAGPAAPAPHRPSPGEPAERELPGGAERAAASPHELTARRLGLLLDVTKALGL